MKDERETRMGEPDAEQGRYEAQAGSSAPATPGQRETETPPDDASTRSDVASINQRASTTKTQPMGRLEGEPPGGGQAVPAAGGGSSGLMNDQKLEYFAGRWDSIQAGFVDDPRRTVEQADHLVAQVIDHLATLFKDERAKLEGQWSRSGEANTEDLRIAMQRYRDFFQTLVGR